MSSLVKAEKAFCHPTRKRVTDDGLCAACLVEQSLQEGPTALENRKVRGALRELHKNVEHVKELGEEAAAILEAGLPRYAMIHMQAAMNAAVKGDARPAEWALKNVAAGGKNVVKEQTPASGPVDTGVKVFVGVKVSGLPTTPDPVAISVVDEKEDIIDG